MESAVSPAPVEPRHPGKGRLVLVLGLLTSLGAIGIDMALASIPSMAVELGTSLSLAQQTVGLFVLGMGLGQVPSGLISDRIGRVPVLMTGVAVFTVAGVASAFAASIEFMLMARFVQGLGASVGIVVARAVVRDIASGEEAARMLALMVMIFTAGPIFAPIVGGLLVDEIGWRAPFGALAAVGSAVLLLVVVVLTETGRPEKQGRVLHQFAFSVREFLANRHSILGLVLIALPAIGFMTVIAGASPLIVGIYGFDEAQFGLIFALAGCSVLIGSLLNRRLLRRSSNLQAAGAGSALIGFGALNLLVIAWLGEAPFWWVWGSVCVYFVGYSFQPSSAMAMALDPLPHVAGAAASFIGCAQSLLAACGAIAAGFLYDGSLSTSILLMGVFGTLALLVYLARNLILGDQQQGNIA